jgi:hypothetical protein
MIDFLKLSSSQRGLITGKTDESKTRFVHDHEVNEKGMWK